MEFSENRTLRGGRPCWLADDNNTLSSDTVGSEQVDTLIVGAGIVGSMVAERLVRSGRDVLLLDRRPPAHGSTAASTALVMWGCDIPLSHLGRQVGCEEAARRWRRVYTAVRNLAQLIDSAEIDCGRTDRPELYLAGNLLNESGLRDEEQARLAANLPTRFMTAKDVAARFDIAARSALLSDGSYEVDPVRLALGLLRIARKGGAKISFPSDVTGIETCADTLVVRTSDGREFVANQVVLASGYERPIWYLPAAFSVSSSYAIATPPATAPLWRENALLWEASTPYLYARATQDGRIIAGGEDESFDDAQQRDGLIGSKSGTLQAKLASMIHEENVVADCAWGAAFGSSPDGLPAIGRASGHDRLWLASGFGGNGVTFAALAAEIIGADLGGVPDPDAACFDPYRFDGTL